MEFIWPEENINDQRFPQVGMTITVTGRLETYTEGVFTFAHLVDAEIVWEE